MESEGGERGNDLSRELSAEQTTEQRGNSQSMELTMEGVVASRSGQVLLAHTLLKSDHFPGCQNLKLKPLIDGAPNFRKIDGLPVYVPTALAVNWSGMACRGRLLPIYTLSNMKSSMSNSILWVDRASLLSSMHACCCSPGLFNCSSGME